MGYCYEEETGFYYVSSRYYDPEVGRFISADTTDILGVDGDLYDKNLYAYCDNNPVTRIDITGEVWETVFDVITIGGSAVELIRDPKNPMAWVCFVGDAVDLIPFVTGVGESLRALKVADRITISRATDFTDDALEEIKKVKRSNGLTKSNRKSGKKIHDGYKATPQFSNGSKEYRGHGRNIRPDYFDGKTVYELKPMNPRGIYSGVRQLQRYRRYMGRGYSYKLELY